jgi:hypothetical protein
MAADVRVAADDRDHRLLPRFSPVTVSGAGASAAMYAL